MMIRSQLRNHYGFTLLELLIVLTVVLLVAVLVAPILFDSSYASKQAASLVQAAIMSARDEAARSGRPGGLRLLPDPAMAPRKLANQRIDPTSILCVSRIIPIEQPADYSEGRVNLLGMLPPGIFPGFPPSYMGSSTEIYNSRTLMIEEAPFDIYTGLANPPTNWFWNVRIGDKITIGESNAPYTIVGPMTIPNPHLFVNAGTPGVDFPGTRSPLRRNQEVEFLFLVNGQDDNGDGFIDEGFDGIDNNGNQVIDELLEWEQERWLPAQASVVTINEHYSISRRPIPANRGVETVLPSNIVIDLSTWASTRERSRLPVDPLSGGVDILISPTGQVIPSTIYSNPASVGLESAFYHFWFSERSDLFDPDDSSRPLLPIPEGSPANTLGRELKGAITILSLNARTGSLSTTTPAAFDTGRAGTSTYDPSVPFLNAEHGVR